MSQKLSFKWLGPDKIYDAVKDMGTSILEELDELRLADTSTGDRLKRFHPWQRPHLDRSSDLRLEETLTLDEFLARGDNSDLSNVPKDLF